MASDPTYTDADIEIPYPPIYHLAGNALFVLIIGLSLSLMFIIAPIIAGMIGKLIGYNSDFSFTLADATILAFFAIPAAALAAYRQHVMATVGQWVPLHIRNAIKIMTTTLTFRGDPQQMEFSANVVLWLDSQEMLAMLEGRTSDLEKLIKNSFSKGLKVDSNRIARKELEEFLLYDTRIPHVKKIDLTNIAFKPVYGRATD